VLVFLIFGKYFLFLCHLVLLLVIDKDKLYNLLNLLKMKKYVHTHNN